ncbi:unnamed protein product [Rotaria magnacalcarata]|uniref:Carbonic anhydrase n=2 Tax=Rotaria magnacalcarata TaxID=392030 RepID=A0A816GEM8_9BILA|nr:unnamed protein product [Rotaria magnacalcarata]CAF1673124.1 unnamed protein product [Rotaria magnacalcarata]CAF2085218.1 unnamed protein product [Rotaria magnacalcarata]CAF2153332.1 unnamed protein product [Rotaria magnacalcarata]CAF2222341.1 unnamed protein product [Rotaria magnacalcarata]
MSCAAASDDYWSYDNPNTWHEKFPAAGGRLQSPINIKLNETVRKHYPPFVFSSHYKDKLLFTMKNTGHQVAVTLAKINDVGQPDLWFTGGGLDGTFHFINFHLHWGSNDRHGSEHEIDGREFPSEAHFVHKNYKTNQVAVFAFFFDIAGPQHEENVEWQHYANGATHLKHIGDTFNRFFDLSHLMQIEGRQFFRYTGSLTTPPCTEGIIWTIFPNTIPIAETSLNLLRNNVMRKVYRPVQQIHDRIIYRNYED